MEGPLRAVNGLTLERVFEGAGGPVEAAETARGPQRPVLGVCPLARGSWFLVPLVRGSRLAGSMWGAG